jgi:3-hydroxyisobutyrate dehydrogenase-like beta-hydroxyacid dehydrogenase
MVVIRTLFSYGSGAEVEMKIGVVGLGIIGSRMAANWRKAGHDVVGWNRTAVNAAGLGVPLCRTPAQLAGACEAIMVVVSDPAAVESVISGPDGVATVSLAGKLVMNATTVDAAANRRAAAAVHAAGGAFLETPFTGSKDVAESAKLVFYAGGESEVVWRAEPLLLQVGARVFHFGPVGAASDVKLAMNMMIANIMQAMVEALSLVKAAGVDLHVFEEAYRMNASWSGLSSMKLPKLMQTDFSPHFSVKHMSKDMGLALKRAAELGVELPHTGHMRALFEQAMAQGLGDLDFSALALRRNPEAK